MNIIKRAYCRTYQGIFRIAMKVLNFRIPEVHHSLNDIPSLWEMNHCKHPLIVSDEIIINLNPVQNFLTELKSKDISFDTYIDIKPDPSFESIERLYQFYNEHNCDCILAIGGGSVIDASKALGCKTLKPEKTLDHFKGVLKVGKDIPYFIAVPTTAGTGSETTVASVVTNEKTNDKFAINDGHLIPQVAVLDDALLENLPPKIIATTGMDAFTHAIEAYIGHSGTKLTDDYATKAMKAIKDHLYDFYLDSHNDIARKNMLEASFNAGVAFTRAYVGYVHALAHSIGGVYHMPHGLCIAILLPYVLEAYGKNAYKKLAEVSDLLELKEKTESEEIKAKAVISWIKEMNQKMNIPSSFEGKIQDKDLDFLASHSANEGNPLYPVPKEFNKEELKEIIRKANK
jgi:alcohol dehydrogenase class IV